jgi:hypothetical protein
MIGDGLCDVDVPLIQVMAGQLHRSPQRARRHRPPRRFTSKWALCAALLVALFACLETLASRYAAGHPAGLTAMLGHEGWWAIPVAIFISLALAAVLHCACWVALVVRGRSQRPAAWPGEAPAHVVWMTRDADAVASAPWLGGWSSRGPPSANLRLPTAF